MALRAGVHALAGELATELRLDTAAGWAGLLGKLQDALERNGIVTASDFCTLFVGSLANTCLARA